MSDNNHQKKDDTGHRPDDLRFMNSLSAAVLATRPEKHNVLLNIIAAMTVILLIWASVAKIDERTRGEGRVIPSHKIQVVQNLEGGIIKEILVAEGEFVEKGQVLVSIDDTGAGGSFEESVGMINELMARAIRLRAESGIKAFGADSEVDEEMAALLRKEKRLYDINCRRKKSEKDVLSQRLHQREIELAEAKLDIASLQEGTRLIAREMELTKPLFQKRLVSELEFIQLKQRALDKKHEYESAQKRAAGLRSKIIEAKKQIAELEEGHRGEAHEEFNRVMAEIERMSSTQAAIEDRVLRTSVRSPVDGTIKQLLVNTVGGVVKPGMEILEIVPNDKRLLVEAKIRPADIAFLYPGQKAVVKFSAYDFAIHGGLEGKVVHISADTISDERQNEFYLVRVKTDRNYLGTEESKKKIMVGMTAQVDIITGKKSIMQYILKPILRAKNNALREK